MKIPRENKYLQTLVDARGPLRPSRVTTSKPTLFPPSLSSPIEFNYTNIRESFTKKNTHFPKYGNNASNITVQLKNNSDKMSKLIIQYENPR